MAHQLDLSDETYRLLLQRAVSFEDTAEDVIRRLLTTQGSDEPELEASRRHAAVDRAAPGSILPEREYWPSILAVLREHGGSAAANDVIEEVGVRMRRRLLPRDFEELQIGEIRWRNRVRFARLRMKEKGLLSDRSPRGIWEMTAAGTAYLDEHEPL
jgi:hypothetical protein